jgi:hypothetical protein
MSLSRKGRSSSRSVSSVSTERIWLQIHCVPSNGFGFLLMILTPGRELQGERPGAQMPTASAANPCYV